jgi:nucleoside-diphosphate-sugar epimerase
LPEGTEPFVAGSIENGAGWELAFAGQDVVFHLAAQVHSHQNITLADFRLVNSLGVEILALKAAINGVRRFVYLSSIGVNGSNTIGADQFSEDSEVKPYDFYSTSKLEGEQRLRSVQKMTGMEVVIVRPPLVYGGMAHGNFARLMWAVSRGVPLPLGSLRNQRDMIYIGNLVDVLGAVAAHPSASGKTFVVSDGQSISTTELLLRLANALGVPSRLFSFPPLWLGLAAKAIGKSLEIERVTGSLRIDSNKVRYELGWEPPYTLREGLQFTADEYMRHLP